MAGAERGLAALCRFIDDDLQRRWIEAVARILVLRAVRDGDEQMHIGAKVDVIAGLRGRLLDLVAAVRVLKDFHEGTKGARDILLRDAQGSRCKRQVLPAITSARHAVAAEVGRLIAAAAGR